MILGCACPGAAVNGHQAPCTGCACSFFIRNLSPDVLLGVRVRHTFGANLQVFCCRPRTYVSIELLRDAWSPRRQMASRAGHPRSVRYPEKSLWDPSRRAATFCLSPPPRAVQDRLYCWWRRQVPSMGRRGAGEGPLWRGWLGGVERQKTSKLSEKALNLPSYLGGQIDLIMSSFMGLKTGMT